MAKSTKSAASRAAPAARPIATWGTADRLDLLQTYVQIVEAGSLSAAAARLGTTQPTVSRRLQQLERALGRRLLNRSTHQLKPSEDGERCYRRAKELLAGWLAFDADLQGDAAEPEGLLRVVVPHAFGQQLLVDVVAEFMRRHPRVTIEWELRDTAPDFIADGVDCAILVGAPGLLAGGKPFADARDLAGLPWLAFKTFYQKDIVLTRRATGDTRRLAIRPRFATDNLYALRSAALHGLGAGVISSWLVADELAAGTLVPLAPGWDAPPLPVYLVYPYARFHPPRLLRFVESVRTLLTAALGDTLTKSPPKSPG